MALAGRAVHARVCVQASRTVRMILHCKRRILQVLDNMWRQGTQKCTLTGLICVQQRCSCVQGVNIAQQAAVA
jgi:hypothetical protein